MVTDYDFPIPTQQADEVVHLANLAMHSKGKDQRWGQALFNALHTLNPEAAQAVRATSLDPFYAEYQHDPRIIAFYNRVLGL
jgi:predicted N-acetyltransferase YhbS